MNVLVLKDQAFSMPTFPKFPSPDNLGKEIAQHGGRISGSTEGTAFHCENGVCDGKVCERK
jgi:hypothetical protein